MESLWEATNKQFNPHPHSTKPARANDQHVVLDPLFSCGACSPDSRHILDAGSRLSGFPGPFRPGAPCWAGKSSFTPLPNPRKRQSRGRYRIRSSNIALAPNVVCVVPTSRRSSAVCTRLYDVINGPRRLSGAKSVSLCLLTLRNARL